MIGLFFNSHENETWKENKFIIFILLLVYGYYIQYFLLDKNILERNLAKNCDFSICM